MISGEEDVDLEGKSTWSASTLDSEDRKPICRKRKPIVVLDIDIGDGSGRTPSIVIFKGDDPNVVAQQFCVKYGLETAKILPRLVKGIQQNIQQANKLSKRKDSARRGGSSGRVSDERVSGERGRANDERERDQRGRHQRTRSSDPRARSSHPRARSSDPRRVGSTRDFEGDQSRHSISQLHTRDKRTTSPRAKESTLVQASAKQQRTVQRSTPVMAKGFTNDPDAPLPASHAIKGTEVDVLDDDSPKDIVMEEQDRANLYNRLMQTVQHEAGRSGGARGTTKAVVQEKRRARSRSSPPMRPPQRSTTPMFRARRMQQTQAPSARQQRDRDRARSKSRAVAKPVQQPKRSASARRSRPRASTDTQDIKPDGQVFQRLYSQAEQRLERLRKRREEMDAMYAKLRNNPTASHPKGRVTSIDGGWYDDDDGETPGDPAAATERLYRQGLRWRERLDQMHDTHKEQLAEEQLKQCTFHPEITGFAKTMDRPEGWAEYRQRDLHQEVYDQMRQERDEMEVLECSFMPTITERSRKLAQMRRKSTYGLMVDRSFDAQSGMESHATMSSTYDCLYFDAERRRIRQEQTELMVSSNQMEPGWAVDSTVVKSEQEQEQIIDRLLAFKADKERVLDQKRNEKLLKDPATGQALFQPKVGRAPNHARNTTDMPIGEFLHASRHEYNDAKARLVREYDRKMRDQYPKPSKTSQEILARALERRNLEIFQTLMEPASNLIDLTVDGQQLDAKVEQLVYGSEIQSLVRAMLEEWRQAERQLVDQEMFVAKLSDRLTDISKTHVPLVSNIVATKATHSTPVEEYLELTESELTFAPKISPRSSAIVKQMRDVHGLGSTLTSPTKSSSRKETHRFRKAAFDDVQEGDV